MKIDIISDTVCPWCLIGKRKLELALAQKPEIKASIHWRPFQLHPDMPPAGRDRKKAIAEKFGNLEKARERYAEVAEAGSEVGIDFNFEGIERTPNTINSHRLIYWSGKHRLQNELVEILFRKFFIDGEDIGDNTVLVNAAIEVGMDGDAIAAKLETDEDIDRILSEEAEARKFGVEGVPFFIIERKYGLKGAQPPEAFLQVFEALAEADVLT